MFNKISIKYGLLCGFSFVLVPLFAIKLFYMAGFIYLILILLFLYLTKREVSNLENSNKIDIFKTTFFVLIITLIINDLSVVINKSNLGTSFDFLMSTILLLIFGALISLIITVITIKKS
jgi:CDP-diglyceride synthetase